MGYENIPEVDLSELKPATAEWEKAKSEVWKAATELGCFRVVFNNLPLDLPNSIVTEQKELFDLPMENKMKNCENVAVASGGYMGKSPFTPLFESIGFYNPFSLPTVDELLCALSPPGKPHFGEKVHEYSKQISELADMIVRMIMEKLGVEKYLEEYLNSICHALRLQKYDLPNPADEEEVGLHPHKDRDIITILYQNEVDGLEVETKDGYWIKCKPSPHNFIVMFGESLYAWTNGRVQAPYHRVTMKGKQERHSVGLFTIFKMGYIVKAPKELVDEQHPLLYKPFDFAQVLEWEQRNYADNYQTSLKPYVPFIAHFGAKV